MISEALWEGEEAQWPSPLFSFASCAKLPRPATTLHDERTNIIGRRCARLDLAVPGGRKLRFPPWHFYGHWRD